MRRLPYMNALAEIRLGINVYLKKTRFCANMFCISIQALEGCTCKISRKEKVLHVHRLDRSFNTTDKQSLRPAG